jgi:hypothetical protein
MANEDAKFRIGAVNATKQAFDEIKRSMREVEGASGKLQTSLAGIGAGLSVAGLAAFAKSGINAADELGKLSQKVGVSVESLSAFQYAAKLADVSSEELSTGLRQLAKNAADAQANTGDAKDAFKALGIAVGNSSGQLKGTEQLLLEVSEKFAGIEDGAGKTALAMKIFGRAGADLIPLLNGGRAGFEELRLEAERLGLIISGDTARAAEKFNDNLTRLASSADKVKFALADSILPSLNKLVEQLLAGQRAAGGFAEALRLFSTINPFRDIGTNISEYSKKVEQLEKLRDRNKSRGLGTAGLEAEIADNKKRLEFLKFQQRQEALALGGSDTPGERARMGGLAVKAAAPKLPGADGTKDKRFETALEQLTQEAQKVQELTRFEEVLAEIQRGRYGNLTQAQRDRLTALAAEVDLRKEDAQTQREADAAAEKFANDQIARIKKESEELAALTRQYKDLADPLAPLIRKRLEIQALEGVPGGLTSDEATAALFAIEEQIEAAQGLNRELKDTENIARDIGLTFSSAFEDAVIGGEKFRDVLKGIAQDIARLIIRKTVTEPAGKFLSEGIGKALEGIFKAEGGPVTGGSPYIVGERGPELFVPGSSGSIVPNHALGSGGSTYIIDARGADRAGIAQLERTITQLSGSIERRAVAAVQNDRNRSGDRR